MKDSQNITVLPTVFGTLRPGKTYSAVNASSGPFSGCDLLDATYGYGDRIPLDLKPCRCGAEMVAVQANIVATCGRCDGNLYHGLSLVLEEDLPGEITARLKGARYEFFANVWWRLDSDGDRVRMIRKPSKVAELDRLAGRSLPKRQERPAKQSWTAWYQRSDGALRTHPVYVEPVCDCLMDEDEHEAYRHGLAGTYCPVHGADCAFCATDHFHEDSE